MNGHGMALLISLGVAASSGALVVFVYLVLQRRRLEQERAVRDRLLELAGQQVRAEREVLRGGGSARHWLDRLVPTGSFADAIQAASSRTGVGWSVGRVSAFALLGALAGMVSSLFLPLGIAALLGALAAAGPFLLLARRLAERTRRIEKQLPEAVDMLVNALRAGYSLPASMQFVGAEIAAPVGPELLRFHDEQRLGVDTRQALDNLQRRLGTVDARMLVLAVTVQRETGGNLSEILGNIASVVRGRIAFRGQVEVLTAESRASAVMLAALPLVLFVILRVISPEYTAELTDTDTGRSMLSYAALSLTVGFFWLRRTARVEM